MDEEITYIDAVKRSDAEHQRAIKEAALSGQMSQKRLEEINREAKARLTQLYRQYHPPRQ